MTAQPTYLDVQAAIGITKHNGGFAAAERLLALCRARPGQDVLYVGSGIGVGPVHLVRHYGDRVTALDIDPRMLDWTELRARRDGAVGAITKVVGDVRDLPLPDAGFDLVIVESVLAFVADKQAALAECARVTRPGGWVGMNEALWIGERPDPETCALGDALGTWLPTRAEWAALWDGTGLLDRRFEVYPVTLGSELRSRIAWIGWRWLLPAWGRALRLAATDPGIRAAIREQFGFPPELAALMGYSLAAGRVP